MDRTLDPGDISAEGWEAIIPANAGLRMLAARGFRSLLLVAGNETTTRLIAEPAPESD